MSRRPPLPTLFIYAGILLIALTVDSYWFSSWDLVPPDADLKAAFLVIALILGIVWSLFPDRIRALIVAVGALPTAVLSAARLLSSGVTWLGFLGLLGSPLVWLGGIIAISELYLARGAATAPSETLRLRTLDRILPSGVWGWGAFVLAVSGGLLVIAGIHFGFGGWQYIPEYHSQPLRTDLHWTLLGAAILLRGLWPKLQAAMPAPGFTAIGILLFLLLGHFTLYLPYRYYDHGFGWVGYLVFVGGLLIFLSGALRTHSQRREHGETRQATVVSGDP